MTQAGCAVCEDPSCHPKLRRMHPMLVAARMNQVNMFGDLDGASEVGYFSRTSVSLRRHTFSELGGDFDSTVDSTGQRLVFASTRHNCNPDLYVKSVDGVAVTQLTSDPSSDVQPAVSPDSTRVAFSSDRGGNWDIWVVPFDGGSPVQVTHDLADEVHPSWSPDGTQLVFCSLQPGGGQWELTIADAEAGGTKRFIGYGVFPEWAPTGDTILYQRAREHGSRLFGIWTLTLVDGEPRYPTELASGPYEAMIQPTWSPDGAHVAFVRLQAGPDVDGLTPMLDGTSDVWLMTADGRGKIRLTDGYTANYAPVFSAAGRVFFTTSRSGCENVWSVRPAMSFGGSTGGKVTDGALRGPKPALRTRTAAVTEGS